MIRHEESPQLVGDRSQIAVSPLAVDQTESVLHSVRGVDSLRLRERPFRASESEEVLLGRDDCKRPWRSQIYRASLMTLPKGSTEGFPVCRGSRMQKWNVHSPRIGGGVQPKF